MRRAVVVGWPVLQQTAAAAAAWLIAVNVLDRAASFFAPIAAVVGLNAPLGELARALADLAARPDDRAPRQHAADRALELAGWVGEHGAQADGRSALATASAAGRMVAVDVLLFAGVHEDAARDAVQAVVEDVEVADPPEPPGSIWRRLLRPLRSRLRCGASGAEVGR